jgi:sulfite exporter TauE/SafE/copper chaperone CopZ
MTTSTDRNGQKFFAHGMYCSSCVTLMELELAEISGVEKVSANLSEKTVTVTGSFGGRTMAEVAEILTGAVSRFGYKIAIEPEKNRIRWADFLVAAPVALAFVLIYLLLQKAGIVRLVRVDTMSYLTAFLIGVVASLSTCMAVVGGMVLSVSATYAKGDDNFRPQLLFHVGRILAFFVLGGLIGAAGTLFQLSGGAMFALTLGVGIVMLLLGLKLLDVFPPQFVSFTVPRFLSRPFTRFSQGSRFAAPISLGAVTFVLPCAFTQAMQFYTLSAGGFLPGALLMTAFAVGTFPVLALLSFSAFSFKGGRASSIFFKTSGLIVVAFALFNIVNSLAIVGLISPIFRI